jgi:hypothetical protein
VGHWFSLVLSREIANDELAILQNSGYADAVSVTDSLPTDADVTVAKTDFDDTKSPSLAEAIEAALLAVKKVPDPGVPSLAVPAKSAKDARAAGARQEAAPAKGNSAPE